VSTKNARFWIFIHGSDVKITLRKGDQLAHGWGTPTDEGWRREFREWTFDGEFVIEVTDTTERDCDGVMDFYNESRCHVEDLDKGSLVDGKNFPHWKELSHRQRDHAAEAAGY